MANNFSVACGGIGGQAPVSLAEFTLGGWQGLDYYDISNVDVTSRKEIINLPRRLLGFAIWLSQEITLSTRYALVQARGRWYVANLQL